MPPGDAQRMWFPEMLEALTAAWSPSTTWQELADLCSRMTEQRKTLRQSRGILAPLMRCPKCGTAARADDGDISIRSALFALKKSGTVTDADFKRLDADWKKHRAAHCLDPYGRKSEATSTRVKSREHTPECR